jgi:hypothetical protein
MKKPTVKAVIPNNPIGIPDGMNNRNAINWLRENHSEGLLLAIKEATNKYLLDNKLMITSPSVEGNGVMRIETQVFIAESLAYVAGHMAAPAVIIGIASEEIISSLIVESAKDGFYTFIESVEKDQPTTKSNN